MSGDQPQLQQQDERRWWEFYFVRYAMGTVVGAIAVYVMVKSDQTLSKALLLNSVIPDQSSGSQIDISHSMVSSQLSFEILTLFVVLGLSFCYIASAPILVLYVGRYLSMSRYLNCVKTSVHIFAMAITFLIAFFVFRYPLRDVLSANSNSSLFTVGVFLLSLILAIQAPYLLAVLLFRNDFYDYYKKLALARAEARKEGTDIVESYRHIREHGNSFAIVVFEIILALIIVCIAPGVDSNKSLGPEMLSYSLILLIWIVPAFFVWFVGLRFEREFWLDHQK